MKLLAILFFLLTLSGCVATLPSAGPAVVVVSKQAESANNGVQDLKVGEACALNVLSIVAVGDASVAAAKRASGVSTIATIDRKFFGINIWYIKFGQSCTVISGT